MNIFIFIYLVNIIFTSYTEQIQQPGLLLVMNGWKGTEMKLKKSFTTKSEFFCVFVFIPLGIFTQEFN